MARQNRSTKSEAVDPTTEAPATEGTEAPATETPTPEVKVEVPIDLTAFEAAVAEALTKADKETGELPDEAIAPVNEAYRAVEGNKGKAAARDFLQKGMLEAVGKLDALVARGYSDLTGKLSAAGGTKSEKAPADPKAAHVAKLSGIRLAYQIAAESLPEGVDADEVQAEVEAMVTSSVEAVNTYKAWLNAEVPEGEEKPSAPEVPSVVKQAFKLASGKVGGRAASTSTGSTGPRKSTAPHILSAFADKEIGDFMTIAEIANHKSAEYGDETPSQGAISARLFPTTTLEGIEPVEKGAIDGKNPKGARKIAVAS